MIFDKIFKKTTDKANEAIEVTQSAVEETKEKVGKLADSADKFLSDGNNQMKTITIVAIFIGIGVVLSSAVTIGTSLHAAKTAKTGSTTVNIYINKGNGYGKEQIK